MSIHKTDVKSFYDDIVKLTTLSLTQKSDKQTSIKTNIDNITNGILKGYETNIKLAAERGTTHAYICLYTHDAMFNFTSLMNEYINTPDTTVNFDNGIKSVLERLQEFLHPFVCEVVFPLDLESENRKNIIAIIVRW